MKPKWWFNVHWSPYTGLAFKVPSWKHRQVDLYIAEYIIFMRMRHDMLEEPIHTVMFDNQPVEVVA